MDAQENCVVRPLCGTESITVEKATQHLLVNTKVVPTVQ